MRRFIRDGGRLWPSIFFDPPVNPVKGSCPHCGGSGRVRETIDEERADVLVACIWCQIFCKACDQYVGKAGHTCKGS